LEEDVKEISISNSSKSIAGNRLADFLQHVQKIVSGNKIEGKLIHGRKLQRGEEWGKKSGKPVRESAEVEKSRW